MTDNKPVPEQDKKEKPDDPAGDWLAEIVPEPEPWPEPLPADRTAQEPQPQGRSGLRTTLGGVALGASAYYLVDSLDDTGGGDSGGGGEA